MKCRISFIQQGFEAESTGYKGALKFAKTEGKMQKQKLLVQCEHVAFMLSYKIKG